MGRKDDRNLKMNYKLDTDCEQTKGKIKNRHGRCDKWPLKDQDKLKKDCWRYRRTEKSCRASQNAHRVVDLPMNE